jgi:hypothetical protein
MQKSRLTMPSPQEREEALFRAAIELPPGVARQAFLDQACDGDSALRQRLEALLAARQPPDDLRSQSGCHFVVSPYRQPLSNLTGSI